MKVILTLFFVLAPFCTITVFAEEMIEIKILLQDQICEKDPDCTVVETSCIHAACECGGKPVNKLHVQKYEDLLNQCREIQKQRIIYCEMDCPATYEKCVNGECAIVEGESQVLPNLKASEVRKIADQYVQEIAQKDLSKFKEPEIKFVHNENKWELFYALKESWNVEFEEWASDYKNNFYVQVDDLTSTAEMIVQ